MQVISFSNTYASGSKRLAAWFIDSLLVATILTVFFSWQFTPFSYHNDMFNTQFGHWHLRFWSEQFALYKMVKFAMATLYFALMESSKYQGTIGKIVLGIKVTDLNGQTVTFPKALLRNLSKIISGLLFCVGYIMIVFDDKHQGLHDKIADTLVVRN